MSGEDSISWGWIVTTIIALLGGVPGAVGVWHQIQEYRHKSRVYVTYDPNQSMVAEISADDPAIDGRMALLLYRVHLAGEGSERFHVRDMNLLAGCRDGVWRPGVRFAPVQADKTDPGGVTMKAVHIISGSGSTRDDIYVAGWEDFRPGQLEVGYGEPATFSYAARFGFARGDLEKCNRFRIRVDDYLGNVFTKDVDAQDILRRGAALVLDQKPRKDD